MKKLLIGLLAVTLCFALVGCGEKEETDNTIDKTTERSEPVGE
jgi:uncharacterized lipoprotein YehR (DUF1307 family)